METSRVGVFNFNFPTGLVMVVVDISYMVTWRSIFTESIFEIKRLKAYPLSGLTNAVTTKSPVSGEWEGPGLV